MNAKKPETRQNWIEEPVELATNNIKPTITGNKWKKLRQFIYRLQYSEILLNEIWKTRLLPDSKGCKKFYLKNFQKIRQNEILS